MAFPGQDFHRSRWKKQGARKTKMGEKNPGVSQWRKVEKASESALLEVLNPKRLGSDNSHLSLELLTCDQLSDHDEAYTEAQALLCDWLNTKMRLELESNEEDDPDEQTTVLSQRKCAGVSNQQVADQVHTYGGFLQELMEQEVLDCGAADELALGFGQTRRKFRNPAISMEARHLQVRENRARREAERLQRQRTREMQQVAMEEMRRLKKVEEVRRKQEALREEEMVKNEMVKLRRKMQEKKSQEQLRLQRERTEGQKSSNSLQPTHPPAPTGSDLETACKEQKVDFMIHMMHLKCLQRHFSGWYSVVLDLRLRMGKAKALCDWRRELRAWRAWQAALWSRKRQREVARTEEELRGEHRHCKLAEESDRRRLLRRYLQRWQLWCRTEQDKRTLLAQQQETRRKMAALISAAATGRLRVVEKQELVRKKRVEGWKWPEFTEKEKFHNFGSFDASGSLARPRPQRARHQPRPATEQRKARWHAAASFHAAETTGPKFQHRNSAQQQIIVQQRKLLKEQQEQIKRLTEQQSRNHSLQFPFPSSYTRKSCKFEPRPQRESEEGAAMCDAPRLAAAPPPCSHPIITAMEKRAQQRAERRRAIDELKRKKEEERLVRLKEEEEQKQKEKEMERCKEAERRREEKRLEKMREEEKERQLLRQQELLKVASQHYLRTLLLRRGLSPWKLLIQQRKAKTQLAVDHHKLSVLTRCTRAWHRSARESCMERDASADQMYRHSLLRRSLRGWKTSCDWQVVNEERAARVHRSRTLRRCLKALVDYMTEERLLDWDRQEVAREHNRRRLQRQSLRAWKELPHLQRKARERDRRREKLGRKVSQVLPDFYSRPPGGLEEEQEEEERGSVGCRMSVPSLVSAQQTFIKSKVCQTLSQV
ncbi:coiled-coil domain-containing protein 191 isoform X2 [Synchiropus splendidus]|uniref:coiled-coil domain-containing protein 191 isoform X2 n=1 Tax=Synchiropus splendidus TaxID=270530 RepID=UPI00237EB531|nr:coiled-coil domain-containing protein 191 isoform X2 [Synchiropus splendidus]